MRSWAKKNEKIEGKSGMIGEGGNEEFKGL
jgi:hypothetical protein